MSSPIVSRLISLILSLCVLGCWFFLLKRRKTARFIKAQLSSDTIVLSAPTSLKKLMLRCRLSMILVLVGIAGLSAGSQFTVLALLVFCGGLEYLGGTTALAWCFFAPMLLFSGVQAWLFHQPLGLDFLQGAMGCAGGLVWFTRHRAFLVALFVTYALIARGLFADPRAPGVLLAFLLGAFIMKAYLGFRERYL